MPKSGLIFRIATLSLIFVWNSGCLQYRVGSAKELQLAEKYAEAGEYELAIEAYRKHMHNRLAVTSKPDWENPYLYLLTIGDLQIQMRRLDEARVTFELAKKLAVDHGLVADRFRALANWYELNNQLEKSVEILKAYRQEDPLLFDAMLDRISKEIVKRENPHQEVQ